MPVSLVSHRRLAVVRDSRNRPAVFSLNVEGLFELSVEDENLEKNTIDLLAPLKLRPGYFVADFDTAQGADSFIYLVVTTASRTDPKAGTFYYSKEPISPNQLSTLDTVLREQLAFCSISQPGLQQVALLSTSQPGIYADVVMARYDSPGANCGLDHAQLKQIPTGGLQLNMMGDYHIANKPHEITLLCPMTFCNTSGVLVLYKEAVDDVVLLFMSPNLLRSLWYPKGIQAVATIPLVNGGQGLVYTTGGESAGLYGATAAQVQAGDAAQLLLHGNFTALASSSFSYLGKDWISVLMLDDLHTLTEIQYIHGDFSHARYRTKVLSDVRCESFAPFSNKLGDTDILFVDDQQNQIWLERSKTKPTKWVHANRSDGLLAEILRITISDSHAPLRDPRNKMHPGYRKGQALWTSDSEETTPITIPLVQRSTLSVTLTFNESLRRKTGKIRGVVPSNSCITFQSQKFDFGSDTDTVIIQVTVNGGPSELPWGISDAVIWNLQWVSNANEGNKVHTTPLNKTPIKIFAVIDDIAPFHNNDGIPVQLLELFVLPTMNAGLRSRDEWITWVVRRCFASKLDEDLAKSKPNLYNAAIHSYRYNTFGGGAPNFWDGRTFDLDDWLTNLDPPGPGRWYAVNCYDMSAIVQIVLGLGIPYTFKDFNENSVERLDPEAKDKNRMQLQKYILLRTVGKVFKNNFGYIKPVDLLGWGSSNNPFFDNEKDKLDETNKPRESRRWGFGNHAIVFIRSMYGDPDEYLVVDACAGPADVPISVQTYLEGVVDYDATRADGGYKGFDTTQPQLEEGVRHIIRDKPTSEDTRIWWGNSRLHVLYENGGIGDAWDSEIVPVAEKIKPIPVPVEALIRKALESASKAFGVTPPEPDINIHVSDKATFTFGPFDVRTADPRITDSGTIIRFDLWTKDSGAPYLSFIVNVLLSFRMALSWMLSHLGSMTHSTDATWNIVDRDIKAGKVLLGPRENLGIILGVLIRSNILVTVDGLAPKTVMDTVLDAMANLMDGYFGKELTIIDAAKMVAIPSESIAVGSPFQLKIEAPGVADLSITSKTKQTYIEQEPHQHDPKASSWIVDCVEVECEKFHKEEKLIVSYAAIDTYYTTTTSYPFPVKDVGQYA